MKQTKSQILKNAIKNAVREVIQEELKNFRKVIQEELRNNKPILEGSTLGKKDIPSRVDFRKFVMPGDNSRPVIANPIKNMNKAFKGNPLADLIADAGNNIRPEEYQTAIAMNSSMAQSSLNMDIIGQNQPINMDLGEIEEYSPPGMPGFNIGK